MTSLKRSISKTTHGLSKHPLYRIYHDIIKRCENKGCRAYKYYGEKGVKMCDEWRSDFVCFYNWAIDSGWESGKEIDKDVIPRKLGVPAMLYSPEMCSIVTIKENMNALSTNYILEHMGKSQTISQWAEEYGVNYKLAWSRLKRGWSIERAFSKHKTTTKESGILKRRIILNTQNGIFYSGVKEAANSIGQSHDTLFRKLCGLRRNNSYFIYV